MRRAASIDSSSLLWSIIRLRKSHLKNEGSRHRMPVRKGEEPQIVRSCTSLFLAVQTESISLREAEALIRSRLFRAMSGTGVERAAATIERRREGGKMWASR